MRRLLILAFAATLAAPANAVVERQLGAFIEGKVLPPGIGATVVATPAVMTRFPTTVTVKPDGSYRLEVVTGTYHVVASAPGYAYAGEEPAEALRVAVAFDRTATLNFDLVPAATISGQIIGAGDRAVVVAMRRSSAPRSQRFTVWAHVNKESGDYTIPNLRAGLYDLLIIAPEHGMVDGRGWLLGKPDALSPADRRAILDLNTLYTQERVRSNYAKMLAFFSKEFSDAAGNTYEKMAEQAARGDSSSPGIVVLARLSWQALLLQGDADSAVGVITQVSQVRHQGVKATLPPERADFVVRYRKEAGAWHIYRMEPVRAYRDLAARITRFTGYLTSLPADYVVTYSDDRRLGNILVAAADNSPGHDYTFGKPR